MTEAENKGVGIARVMWARETGIQPYETETCLGWTARDAEVAGLDATTAGDGEDKDRGEDTELTATTGDREDVAEGEATGIAAAPAASDVDGNSGDIVRDEATKLDAATTAGTSEEGAANEAPGLASNASGEDEDRVGVEVEVEGESESESTELIAAAANGSGEGIEGIDDSGPTTTLTRVLVVIYVPTSDETDAEASNDNNTNHTRFSLRTGTLYHSRLSTCLRTLVHEMAHAYFLAYGCLCGKCLCEKVVRECWGTDGHGACWRIVMEAYEGPVGRLLRLGEEEGREGFNWLQR